MLPVQSKAQTAVGERAELMTSVTEWILIYFEPPGRSRTRVQRADSFTYFCVLLPFSCVHLRHLFMHQMFTGYLLTLEIPLQFSP